MINIHIANSPIKIVIVVMFFLLPCFAFGQEIIVVSTGFGDVISGRESMARDRALENAMRNAVEQAVGTLVQSETVINNGSFIKDEIISKSSGYIKKYDIVEESSDNISYKVSIEASILTDNLKDDLSAIGLMMARKRKPRIMIVVKESHMRRKTLNPAGETEFIKLFSEKGFNVVDKMQALKIRNNDKMYASINGNNDLSAKIGLQHGAEIIIIGKAFSEEVGETYGGMISSKARIEAKAIKTDSGEILIADGKHASAIDISGTLSGKSAIKKASSKLAKQFIEKIISVWSDEVTNTTTVKLIINGINYRDFLAFKGKLLHSIRGVKSIIHRSFSVKRAEVDINIKGDAQSLSEELTVRKIGKFKVNVDDFSGGRLIITVN